MRLINQIFSPTEGGRLESVSALLWELMGPRLPRFAVGLLLMLLSRLAGLVAPVSTKFVVDDVIVRRRIDLLAPLVFAIFGASLIQVVCTLGVTNVVSKEGHRLVAQLRIKVQRHVSLLPISYFDATKAGILASRVIADVEGARNLMGYVLVEYLGSIATAVFSFIYLMRINVILTVAVVLAGVLFSLLSRLQLRLIQPMLRKGSQLQAELTGRLVESLNGIRVVKAYQAELREARDFSSGVERQFANSWATSKAMMKMAALNGCVLGGVSATVTFLAVRQIFWGHLSIGGFMTFMAFVTFLIAPLFQLPAIGSQLAQAISGLQRTQELLREKREDDDPRRLRRIDNMRGSVSFDNVSFAYQSGHPVLTDLSFKVSAGTVTALVGSSGSGKSTIMALIAAFYAPTQGVIRVDDIDLSTIQLESYRSQLGVVFQDTFLFDGTISENIAFGRPNASESDILRAAHIAHVHEFAEMMPKQYDTFVGERGVKLSGGQRQRISIARAILADPRILILDEATSSLDLESEAAIQEGFAYLMKGRTAFVIAHRLTTIHRADRILVIENGQIVEQGTHETLYSANGRYQSLYSRQPGGNLFLAPGEGQNDSII